MLIWENEGALGAELFNEDDGSESKTSEKSTKIAKKIDKRGDYIKFAKHVSS